MTLFDPTLDIPEFIPETEIFLPANCKYFDVNDISTFTFNASFSMLMFNIRSCKKNFNQFLAYFCAILSYFSCIVFTETWLTPERDNIFHIPGFYCHSLYRSNYGGGIKLFIRNGIQSKLLNNFTQLTDVLEMLVVELCFGSQKMLLTTVYHPPSSSHIINNAFIDLFSLHLRSLISLKLPLIVSGDFNLNLLNPKNYGYIDTFINNLFEHGMVPIISIPTKVNIENRITKFAILDQIWVSQNLLIQQGIVIPVGLTDHFPVGAFLDLPFVPDPIEHTYKSRPLLERGKVTFTALLSNLSPGIIDGNFGLTYENYVKRLLDCYNIAFPIAVRAIKSKHPAPWLSYKLKQCIKKKAKLYKLYLRSIITKADYTFYRNRLTAVLRRAKRLYFSKLFCDAGNSSNKIWSYLNGIMERKTGQSLKEVKVGDVTINGQNLANYANRYFVTAASSITSNLTPPTTYPFMTAPIAASCFFHPTNYVEVMLVINGLNKKGNKLLDIHPLVLKENINILSHHFVLLYNMSITETEFPNDCKVARVNPVHKGGPSDIMDNFRPISVLPILSKIFEKLTLIRMNNFIIQQSILSPCQFGFRSGRGTTHAIIKLLSHIIPAYHNKDYSVCFFLDLRKAFDTIDHRILLEKLNHYGFRGHCKEYLKSYYHNRQQFVYLNGHKSEMMTVLSGVPQGSILGPLCFSLFINDMPLAVDADVVLFADDAAFVITSPSLTILIQKVKKLFADLTRYLNANRLVANSSKCKLMMFSSRPTNDLPDLIFAGGVIEWVEEFKYLGLTITNRLSFSKHIDRIATNISRITGTFVNLRSFIPVDIMMKLFYALAFPHLNNHVVLWGSSPPFHLKKLIIRVNNMLRVIFGVRWFNARPTVDTNTLYKSHNLLNIASIFKYNLFKLLRHLLDGKLPYFYATLLEPYISHHSYQTRGSRFRHPALVCEVERKALPHQLILLYENLPPNILDMDLLPALRSFRTYLLHNQ